MDKQPRPTSLSVALRTPTKLRDRSHGSSSAALVLFVVFVKLELLPNSDGVELVAFARTDGIWLCWRLPVKSISCVTNAASSVSATQGGITLFGSNSALTWAEATI